MKHKLIKWLVIIAAVLLLLAIGYLVLSTRAEGIRLVHRQHWDVWIQETPADYGLEYQDVTVTTADGLRLVGWYLPSSNGAAVMALGAHRPDLLVTADILNRHGYGVLVACLRAHEHCEGEVITFGKYEMHDFEAWYQFLLQQPDVDAERIGIMGEFEGAALAIQYAAQNQGIRAVVSQGAYASLAEVIHLWVERSAGWSWLLAPMIMHWAEREAGIDIGEIVVTHWIAELNPRPVLIMEGGPNDSVPANSAEKLFDAAGEPKEYWLAPTEIYAGSWDELGGYQDVYLKAFESRAVPFLDQYLLPEQGSR